MNVENARTLETLWTKLATKKSEEAAARDSRIAAEEEIISMLSILLVAVPESHETITLPSGRKITIKRGLIYKADIEGVVNAITNLNASRADGQKLFCPVKTKSQVTLDEKGYEWYRDNANGVFEELSRFVCVKPRKTAVTITESKRESKS